MRRDDDARVEFVDAEPDTGADEELVQPVGFPRLRRARLPLFVAGAVGLIALMVVNVVNGPSGAPSAAQATVTVSPSTDTPTSDGQGSVTLHLPGDQRTIALPVVTCPTDASCAVWFRTPKRIAAAVHDALPRTTRLRTLTTLEHDDAPGSQLLNRRITGRFASARLSIDVRPASPDDRIGWNATENASRTQVSATQHVDGRLVTVRITAPPGFDIDIAAVRRLAADARLGRLAG